MPKHEFKIKIVSETICQSCESAVSEICSEYEGALCEKCHELPEPFSKIVDRALEQLKKE